MTNPRQKRKAKTKRFDLIYLIISINFIIFIGNYYIEFYFIILRHLNYWDSIASIRSN